MQRRFPDYPAISSHPRLVQPLEPSAQPEPEDEPEYRGSTECSPEPRRNCGRECSHNDGLLSLSSVQRLAGGDEYGSGRYRCRGYMPGHFLQKNTSTLAEVLLTEVFIMRLSQHLHNGHPNQRQPLQPYLLPTLRQPVAW